jgi:general secretion pathway protein G
VKRGRKDPIMTMCDALGDPVRIRDEDRCVNSRFSRLAAVRAQAGMTLIEILVVLTLIGVVLGIVGSNYLGKSEQAKAKAAKIEIEQISQALDLFKLELGRYPTTQEGLQALVSAPPGLPNWAGPYWKKSTTPKDPWSHEYKYASPGSHGAYDIISLGADGVEGGDGANKDITNWEANQ